MNANEGKSRLSVGIVGLRHASMLEISGPAEVFAVANCLARSGGRYDVVFLSPQGEPIETSSGLRFEATHPLEEAPVLDTIIIAGGAEIRTDSHSSSFITGWLRDRARVARRLVSISTGFYALAASGLLDGRRATTHWRYASDAAGRFPRVNLTPEAIFVRDGPVSTSGGASSGIDLALDLVEEDFGGAASLDVAREMAIYIKRSAAHAQLSEPLRFQTRAVGRLAEVSDWIQRNLDGDLSVEILAARANMSPRHFARLFHANFGSPPHRYIQQLQIEEAARRLLDTDMSIDSIAGTFGFTGGTFRRAFERRFGTSPSAYRAQASTNPAARS